MKKELSLLLILVVAVGFMFSFSFVIAESGSGSDGRDSGSGDSDSGSDSSDSDDDSSSGSSDDDSESSDSEDESSDSSDNSGSGSGNDEEKTDDRKTIIDEEGREVEVRTKTRTRDGREETEEKRTYFDADGNKIVIIIETEEKDGRTETIQKRKVTSPDGTEVTFKTKTETREGREKITNSIQVKGIDVTTELSVREETRGNEARLKAQLSTGLEQDILILPDEAMAIALGELKAGGISIELAEIIDGDSRKAVFSAKTTQPGKFLGIFNTQVDLETLIDTETGEIIKTNRPFWAFLVVGQDKDDICHVPEEDENKRRNLNVAITAIKAHVGHGDSLGICVAECGDGIIVEGDELCELDETQACEDVNGYIGIQDCSTSCDGFNDCVSDELCGDGIINGNEACDDSNILNNDGCSSTCELEVLSLEIDA